MNKLINPNHNKEVMPITNRPKVSQEPPILSIDLKFGKPITILTNWPRSQLYEPQLVGNPRGNSISQEVEKEGDRHKAPPPSDKAQGIDSYMKSKHTPLLRLP